MNTVNNDGTRSSSIGNTKTRRRKWVFTLNNYTLEDIEQLNGVFKIFTKRFLFQEETGENGTPHLQGCFNLNKSKYLSWLKNNIHEKAHFEPMNNEEASYDYCSKEETRTGRIYGNHKTIQLYDYWLKLDEPWYKISKYFDEWEEFALNENVEEAITIKIKNEPYIVWKFKIGTFDNAKEISV